MYMVLPTLLVNRFFQLLEKRNFNGAKIVLSRIKARSEWERGYFVALSGMLLSLESRNPRLFINNMSNQSQYREDFVRHSAMRLHADYDRGFFAAWADFCKKR